MSFFLKKKKEEEEEERNHRVKRQDVVFKRERAGVPGRGRWSRGREEL
jgi:hypothetical protein